MVSLTHLKPGEYPSDDQDFVLISIATNGWVRVTARFALSDFRADHFRDGDPEVALHLATERALAWARERNVPSIYVEGWRARALDA